MNWYRTAQLKNIYKESTVWEDIKDMGSGSVDLVKALIQAGIDAKDILKALIKIFGSASKIPPDILQPLYPLSRYSP